MYTKDKNLLGLLAEFESSDDLITAAMEIRGEGYTKWDAHSPFPVHGLDEAMGIKPSRLPYVAVIGGILGVVLGYLMQIWMNEVNYIYIVSGKPLFSIPAYTPISFETTVLVAAFSAFVALLLFTKLPQYYHAVFLSPRFKRATSDSFFISIEASDPLFDVDETAEFLKSIGGEYVERLEP